MIDDGHYLSGRLFRFLALGENGTEGLVGQRNVASAFS